MSTTDTTGREDIFDKAEPAAPATVPQPTAGGSYIRNPETGELTQVQAPAPAVPHLSPEAPSVDLDPTTR